MSAEFVVICGLSGAGRSQAAANLEDLGFFVIDNVPAALIPKVGELAGAPGSTFERVGLVVRSGTEGPEELRAALDQLSGVARNVRIVFLDAPTDVLIRRYEDTRRRHPLALEGVSLADAIEWERSLLEPLKGDADVVVDTGNLNVHQLRDRIGGLFGEEGGTGIRVNVVSFGYKHGLPLDADIVMDVRFLPNPYWDDQLRPLTGHDPAVRDYVIERAQTSEFLDAFDGMLKTVVPGYQAEGRSYLTIAIGCTGGRHRSVAIVEELADRLRARGLAVRTSHRDISH